MEGVGQGKDGIALLMSDHRTVEQLFEQVQRVTGDDKARCRNEIVKELSIHAAIEEQVLYPAMRKTLGQGDDLADHSLEEHQEVKELLVQLQRMDVANLEFDQTMRQLITAVTSHVEEEEGQMFPQLRQTMSQDEIDKLGEMMTTAKKMAPTRPHPNAPDQPPGNVVAGAAAGVVDRIRDAARKSDT